MIRSKYEEDVIPNNHSSVWGSYWHNFQWGYRCCHSLIKNAYCTGEAGKRAIETSNPEIAGSSGNQTSSSRLSELRSTEGEDNENKANSAGDESSNDSSSEEEKAKSKTERTSSSKKKKRRKQKEKRRTKRKTKKAEEEDLLKIALEKEMESQKNADRLLAMDERKRPFNSMFTAKEPTAEEVEAYQMKRPREEDPMAEFFTK